MLKRLIANLIPRGLLVRKGGFKKNIVALTFDDGPHQNTEIILQILDRYKIKATFFLTGLNIEKNPETAKRIFAFGHELGNHTFGHKNVYSARALYNDIIRNQAALNKVTGNFPFLFRMPYGKVNIASLLIPCMLGLKHILWSIDVEDFEAKDSGEIARRFADIKIKNGDIILLHDKCQCTVEALPSIIEKIKNEGFLLGKVTDVI